MRSVIERGLNQLGWNVSSSFCFRLWFKVYC
jgi:hypothetical protein